MKRIYTYAIKFVAFAKACHLLTDLRGVCYSAFATPNLGVVGGGEFVRWTDCLTYKQYKRRSLHKEVNIPQLGSENSY